MKRSEATDLLNLELQMAKWDLEEYLSKNPNMRYVQDKIEKDLSKISSDPATRLKYFSSQLKANQDLLKGYLKELSEKLKKLSS